MERDIAFPWTLSELSAETYVSPTHLARTFAKSWACRRSITCRDSARSARRSCWPGRMMPSPRSVPPSAGPIRRTSRGASAASWGQSARVPQASPAGMRGRGYAPGRPARVAPIAQQSVQEQVKDGQVRPSTLAHAGASNAPERVPRGMPSCGIRDPSGIRRVGGHADPRRSEHAPLSKDATGRPHHLCRTGDRRLRRFWRCNRGAFGCAGERGAGCLRGPAGERRLGRAGNTDLLRRRQQRHASPASGPDRGIRHSTRT